MSEERADKPVAAPKLNDLMLAMDVVDTLRHEQDLVQRELDQANRDDVLKKRLRELKTVVYPPIRSFWIRELALEKRQRRTLKFSGTSIV